ncbi:MAG TPA: hydrolase [Gemmatimonadaceae bacterium]|nr:hydrolase [Gemmatimonadaceae bacterium]
MSHSDVDKFSPAWWLRGPHAQTLWSLYFRPRRLPPLRMEAVPTPDGDRVHLYHRDGPPGQPRVFLLHGLEGSVDSHYVQGIVERARRRGWSTTVLVFRGCGPELNGAPRMYHSGETDDLRHTLDLMVRRFPDQPVFLAGVSLGGNVLLKYLGEDPETVPGQVVAAGTLSVPYDLEAGSRHLQRGFARIYDRHFLRSLRRKAMRKLAQHPGLFDKARLARARTIEDFDDAVTGPIHGFEGSHDYYTQSSSIHFLTRIRKPTLLVSAEDDPFLPKAVLDRARNVAASNDMLTVEVTRHGGHVGFLAGSIPFRPIHWGEDRLMSFFDRHAGKTASP